MRVTTEIDERMGTLTLKVGFLNNTIPNQKAALGMLRAMGFEKWAGIGYVGKDTPFNRRMLKRIEAVLNPPAQTKAAA